MKRPLQASRGFQPLHQSARHLFHAQSRVDIEMFWPILAKTSTRLSSPRIWALESPIHLFFMFPSYFLADAGGR